MFSTLGWCSEEAIQTPLENMTKGQLDQNLRRFYAEARTQKGEPYSKSTLLGFRHGIERYLNAPPHSKGLQLASDPTFFRSNEMLDAQLVNLRRSGKENVTHKPAIEEQHLRQLKTSGVFSLSSPLSLLRNVWLHIVPYFCRRGREGQRALTINSFKFVVDAAGRKFATMAHNESSKNHPGGVSDKPSNEKEARMYETADQFDGYKALKLYLEKVNPNCSSFFQYPKANFSPEEDVWFEQRPLGVNTLANMMKKISEAAGLSKIYTNHSIRAMAITLLSNAGVPNRHIMSISGHRNEQSLAHYNCRPSVSQLKNYSDVLSRALSAPSTSCVTAASEVQSTVEVKSGLRQKANQEIHPLQVAREAAPLFQNCTIQTVQFVFNRLQQI